ncbi:MAG: MarR family transcriptional regulator [Rhodanobacteraceae bacterium]|nr:MarR family transcriptional regulator [Rhodanobacteraceae bacterium]MBK7042902.1 MarR family transcriptional regulator [Rhodanobacteraceae bacterium]MBP9153710.1 MarR family transcriptional regulator [Xanthomonadales bacterium]HQW81099.1 HTH domain-containing protein [Pseudomonadota bacterium]
MTNLASHLFGNTRSAVLAAMLLRPEEQFHVRELARVLDISPGTLHRELKALTALGLLIRRESGRQVYFSANRTHPIANDLSSLLRKTSGLVDVLRIALQPLAADIDATFVYGSMAAGSEQPGSDIDVMVLGRSGFRDVVSALHDTQAATGREVNPTVMRLGEFRRKRDAGDPFVATVWRAPRLWVIGGEHELG